MQNFACGRAVVGLVCVLVVVLAAIPLATVAQTSPGTILFSRTAYDSQGHSTGSSIFSIGDDGLNTRQLTPHVDGEYDIPSVAATYNSWFTNAVNSKGTYSVYLRASFSYQNGYYAGKYFIVNAYGVRTPPMFYGTNDLQDPSAGPGYGSVSWGQPITTKLLTPMSRTSTPQARTHPVCA